MRSLFLVASTLAFSATAFAAPAAFRAEFSTLSRRAGEVMECSSHNYNIMCGTTHVCQGTRVVHNGHNPMQNAFCTTECTCSKPRVPLGEIDPNDRNNPKRRPASPSPNRGGARTRPRDVSIDVTPLERRAGEVMECSSHNYNIMCGTTHVCQGTRVVHNGHNPMQNAFCTTECTCSKPRVPLGEIDPNDRNNPKRRPASPSPNRGGARTRPRDVSAEAKPLERRAGEVMECSSHNYNIMCGTTHVCQGTRVVHNGHNPMQNAFCTTECTCSKPRVPLGEIDPNDRNNPKRRPASPSPNRGGGGRARPRELYEFEDFE